MTNEEAIERLKRDKCLLDGNDNCRCQWVTEEFGSCDECEFGVAIKALETLQHIDTVLNGTLEVHGFPTGMIQEDVFRYKAIINIMKDFDEWQKMRNKE